MNPVSLPRFLFFLLGLQLMVVLAETGGYFLETEDHRLALTTRMVLTAQSASVVSLLATLALIATRQWKWARYARLLYLPYLLFALLPCMFLAPYNLAKFLSAVGGLFIVSWEARKLAAVQDATVT